MMMNLINMMNNTRSANVFDRKRESSSEVRTRFLLKKVEQIMLGCDIHYANPSLSRMEFGMRIKAGRSVFTSTLRMTSSVGSVTEMTELRDSVSDIDDILQVVEDYNDDTTSK